MKHLPLILIFSLMFLTACQESSSKKKSSSKTQDPYCVQYPYSQICTGNTNGGTPGGTTGGATCSDYYNFHCQQNCPGFGTNPSICQGTTGGVTSGATGGTTGGTTPPPQVPSNYVPVNWGVKYPYLPPVDSNCTVTNNPSGATYTPYETRKATITIRGGSNYDPASFEASSYTNTSPLLKSVSGARQLFSTDSVLKVRIRPKVEPEPSQSDPVCFGRVSGIPIAGYTKLQFSVTLVGLKSNGQTEEVGLGQQTIQVNSCKALDLSSYAATYPGGMYLKVQGVKSNKNLWPDGYQYDLYGFFYMNSYRDVRSSECWVLDLEVAADGTKDFPAQPVY